MLIDRGFVRVRPLLGGIEAWGDAGYLFETQESPHTLARREEGTSSSAAGTPNSQSNRL